MKYQISGKVHEVSNDFIPYNTQQYLMALEELAGKDVTLTLESPNKLSKKQRMYNYFHAIVLPVAVKCFTKDGWEGMDEAAAEHGLKALFAKNIKHNSITDQDEVFLIEKKAMTIERLYKFLEDCIHFLESKGFEVPDASEFKRGKNNIKTPTL